MTVAVNDRQSPGLGNGIITTFPFDFPVTVQGTVKVLVNQALVPTNAYTLDKVARTVTFNTAPANGAAISILGETPLAQLITSSRAGSTVNFSAVENQLDNIVNAQQELQYNIDTVIEVAATAAEDAADSAALAVATYDLFDDRYLGDKTSLPTVDNDGAPLVDGALVSLTGQVPSTLNGMYVRRSGVWGPVVGVSTGLFLSYRYVATGGQTVFSGADANGLTMAYTPNSVIVTVNGVTRAPNTYTASNGTSVVFGAGLTASDVVLVHSFGSFVTADAWTKAEANARYDRILTSPTALTNGQTIPNTENGRFYSMALPTVQTATLPSTSGLPDGFSVIVRATGLPAGYQTSFIGGNGKNIIYRNSAVANFTLIGNAEIFRFTWLSGLDQWLAECLQQPSPVIMSRGHNGTTWNSGTTAFAGVPFNTVGGSSPLFNVSSSVTTLVPVLGVYSSRHVVFMSANAGGGTSGTGYLAGIDRITGVANSSEGYTYATGDVSVSTAESLQIYNTQVLLPGQQIGAAYAMSVPTLWIFPGNNTQDITLVSR